MNMPDNLPPAPPLPAILEAALYAQDLIAAETFYGEVLQLEKVVAVPGRHLFYRVGTGMLLIFNPDATEIPTGNADLPVPSHGARGPGHFCFALPREAMPAWITRLETADIAIEADFEWPNGARSVYFRDPFGNSLEMAEPRLWL